MADVAGGPVLAIIADDLTGALDSAAPFADAGLRVRVATAPAHVGAALADGAQVVAVSTRSREIARAAAEAAVDAALAALPQGVALFKKIDSRLKGHVEAELARFGSGPILMLPAIPDFGRIVAGGAVTGFGVAAPIPVAAVLGGMARRAVIPDCASQADMAAALAAAPAGALIVGARGAAQALAARLGADGAAAAPPLPLRPVPTWPVPIWPEPIWPVLVVVGSTDPITMEQLDRLRDACPGLRHIAAPGGAVTAAPDGSAVTVLQAAPGPVPATGAEVAQALARSAVRLADGLADGPGRGRAGMLVLTGGATAESVLDALGHHVLALQGEILPGLPAMRAVGVAGGAPGPLIVTKSGGFGAPDTLVRLVQS